MTPTKNLLFFLGICFVTVAVLLLVGCTTTETFGADGKRTSRTSSPSPETWTTIGNAVATFGATAVTQWTKQIADEQRWQGGGK